MKENSIKGSNFPTSSTVNYSKDMNGCRGGKFPISAPKICSA